MNRDRAAVIAGWWADAPEVAERRDASRAALLEIVEAERFDDEEAFPELYRLEVDHDPGRTLLAALHAAGIECRGVMFSAEGILPMKTRMRISRDSDTVEVSQIEREGGRRVERNAVIFGSHRIEAP